MEYSLEDLQVMAERVIREARRRRASNRATIITFSGDLGAGKTTLIQEIARQLGVMDTLQSPTFVIYKRYTISSNQNYGHNWSFLIHGDMYRLESVEEIEKLGWNELTTDPNNLICIEWPEKITGAIPETALCVTIKHLGGEKRSIEI